MLTAKEAQAMLGVSIRFVYSLAKSGAIAHYKFGGTLRFDEAQILAYKESCVIAARVPKVPKELTVTRVNVSSPTGEKSPLLAYFEKKGIKVRDKL